MKVVEMFTGIGSQAKALSKISQKRNIDIEIVKTCEWNIQAIVAYHIIHNNSPIDIDILDMSKEELIKILSTYSMSYDGKKPILANHLKSIKIDILRIVLQSIRSNHNLLDINKVKGEDIPNDTSLLTYSFPCQDLSNVGSFHGYKNGIDRDKNTRSGLLWQVERILDEKNTSGDKLPEFLLLENVTALEAKRHEGNFKQWQNKLEALGYYNQKFKLNAEDFGIPQYRKRIIMLSIYVGNDENKKKTLDDYFKDRDLNLPKYLKDLNIEKKDLKVYLKLDYNNQIYLKEALEAQPNDTKSRIKIWEKNSKIVDNFNKVNKRVQTITTKQDRHPNSGNIYFDYNGNTKSKYRFLTARECFILMGFDEKDYELLINNNITSRGNSMFFSRDVLYKLAGNSIVVNVLEAVFDQMIDINNLIY